MKKIGCVGHHCTGAGVIDDILRECDNVAQGKSEVEFRILQDVDGVSDLEFNLVENPHRVYSGFALRRYLIYMKTLKRGYRSLFGPDYFKLAEEYVDNLAKFKYRGTGFLGFIFEPWYGKLFYWTRRASNSIKRKLGLKRNLNYLPWVYSYHALCTEEEFLEKTHTYVDKLCERINPQNKEYVVLDQCISPINPSRYIRYVKDMKVVIVDRDPRDIYVQEKKVKEYVLPIADVHQYCQAYRDNRRIVGETPENVLFVKFEDLIIHYEDSVNLVLTFLGIDASHHVHPLKYFNPSVSVRGIGQWRNHPEYSEDIRIIEKELSDMLYPIPDQATLQAIQDENRTVTSDKEFKKFF